MSLKLFSSLTNLRLPVSIMSTTATTNTMTDLLIVGGGPAGLGAASTFARVGRPMVLYDSGLYRNAQSPAAHTIPSHEGVDPAVWREQARKELMANYDWVTLRQSKIISLAKVQQGVEDCQTLFEAKDDHGHVVKARKVIIATGIQDNLPNIQGK
jgi:thioredoxin reductase